MKRYGNLYDRIVSFENLLLAAKKAEKGKRFRYSTAIFNLNFEKEIIRLRDDLRDMSYQHGSYRDFIIFDPKRRLISAAPYRDRVVHHALCNIIEPIFDRMFIHDSYACRKGKGAHAAVDRYTSFSRKNHYVLKCDIRRYFPSIDHEILMGLIDRKIKCNKTLWLIQEIIRTRTDETGIEYFEGDDLFTPYQRKKGIPIGNLTSQFFANVYLNGFDHFIKQDLKCRYYIRYVDDFVTFQPEKEALHEIKDQMVSYLDRLRLLLHEKKSRIYRVEDGVSFLGYRMFPTHRLLDKGNALRMRRKMKRMQHQVSAGELSVEEVQQSIQSWIGHAKHADTCRLRHRVLGSTFFTRGEAAAAAGRLLEQ